MNNTPEKVIDSLEEWLSDELLFHKAIISSTSKQLLDIDNTDESNLSLISSLNASKNAHCNYVCYITVIQDKLQRLKNKA